MKKIKSIMAIMLTLAMSIGLFGVNVNAYAEDSESVAAAVSSQLGQEIFEGYIDASESILQAGGLKFEYVTSTASEELPENYVSLPKYLSDSGSTVQEGTDEELADLIHGAFLTRKEQLDISKFKVPADAAGEKRIKRIVAYLLNINADLFYVNSGFSFLYLDGTMTALKFSYNYSEEAMEAFYTEVGKAFGYLDKFIQYSHMSSNNRDEWLSLAVATALHDYLVLNCNYYLKSDSEDEYPSECYSAYGALVNHQAVCQGYALAYAYLCRVAGYKCYVVTSESMNHAWNLIELPGGYYHVDVTWDDPTVDYLGLVNHKYMFCSDKDFTENKNHKDWVVHTLWDDSMSAIDERYDSSFWKSINSPLVYSNYTWYYIGKKETDGKTTFYIGSREKKLSESVDDEVIVKDGIQPWKSGENSYYQQAFSGLCVYYDNNNKTSYICYNTQDTVQQLTINKETKSTDESTIYKPDDGDNGKLYGFVIETKEKDNAYKGFLVVAKRDKAETDKSNYKGTLLSDPVEGLYVGCSDGCDGSDIVKIRVLNKDCFVPRIEVGYCIVCSKYIRTETADKLENHEYERSSFLLSKATCTEAEKYYGRCAKCGLISWNVEDAVSKGDSLGHKWDAGEIITSPTCEVRGDRRYRCTVCNQEKTEVIELLDHVWGAETVVKAATCTEDGYSSFYCVLCTRAMDSSRIIPIKKTGHTWDDGTVTKEATCTEAGEMTYKCTVSGCDGEKTEPIVAKGHSWKAEAETDKVATCTEAGSKSIHCSTCNAIKSGSEIAIEATGHSWNEGTVTKEATCTEAGEMTYKCTVSGCDGEKTEPIVAKGHSWKAEAETDKAATCTEAGSKSIHCSTCNAIKSGSEIAIEATGHSWDKGTVTKEATCTEAGEMTYKCTVSGCDGEKTEPIVAAGHSWKNEAETDKEATCTEAGSKSIHCSTCNAIKSGSETAIEATGHSWDKGTVTKEATYTEAGELTYMCTNTGCNATKTEPIAQLTPVPTQAPVVIPTQAPVVIPTQAPVVIPTQAPVVIPTQAPVVIPTQAPVVVPTQAPVVIPTEAPTQAPTATPVVETKDDGTVVETTTTSDPKTGTVTVEETVTAPDGTVTETTTETKKDGTVTEIRKEEKADGTVTETTTETKKDGTVTETTTETKKDGTVTEIQKEEKADGTVTETTTETKKDGTVTETTTETKKDGTVTEIQKEEKADGTVTETTTETKKDGSSVEQLVTTSKDGSKTEVSITTSKKGTVTTVEKTAAANGTVTETRRVEKKDGSSTETSVTTTKNGTVTEKEVVVKKDGSSKSTTVKTTAAGAVKKVELLTRADGTNVETTVSIDKNGKKTETVKTIGEAGDITVKKVDSDGKITIKKTSESKSGVKTEVKKVVYPDGSITKVTTKIKKDGTKTEIKVTVKKDGTRVEVTTVTDATGKVIKRDKKTTGAK